MQVASDIAKYFKLPDSRIVQVKDRAFNDQRYFIGSNKLAELGWAERTPWEEGLKRTIQVSLDDLGGCQWEEGLKRIISSGVWIDGFRKVVMAGHVS